MNRNGRKKKDVVRDFNKKIKAHNARGGKGDAEYYVDSESKKGSLTKSEKKIVKEHDKMKKELEEDWKQESESPPSSDYSSDSKSDSKSPSHDSSKSKRSVPSEASEPPTSNKQCTAFYGHCGVDLLWFTLMLILIALGIREATLLIQGSKDDNLRISGVAYCVIAVFVVAFNYFF